MYQLQGFRPLNLMIRGNNYPLFNDNGNFYLYDPSHDFDFPHVELPSHRNNHGMHGLGITQSTRATGYAVAATAANFIPVVGPAVSAAISIAGSHDMAADHRSIGNLNKQIIALRSQLAALRNTLAGKEVDSFSSSNADVNTITNEMLGSFRKKYIRWNKTATIEKLQEWISQFQSKLQNKQLVSQIVTAVKGSQNG